MLQFVKKRWLLIAAGILLLLTLAVWIVARAEKSPLARLHGSRRLPNVVAGLDRAGAPAADRPVASDSTLATLRCRYAGNDNAGMLTAMGERVVQSPPGDLSLALPPGTWSILWTDGAGRATPLGSLDLEAGDSEVCRLEDGGWTVSGHVRTPAGKPLADIEVRACGSRVQTNGDGGFTALSRQRACAVRATLRDGLLARTSDPVTVLAFDAEDVALVLDDTPVAGMGISFHMAEKGARVLAVYPDTPAEEAGVEDGDLIVSVDGTATAGLTDEAFVVLGTGREGSSITIAVERDGERRTYTFRRERVERAEDTGR